MTRIPVALPRARRAATLRLRRLTTLAVLVVASCCAVLLSIAVGSRSIDVASAFSALVGGAVPQDVHDLVWTHRVPRTVAAVLVGGALGLAGAVMQALTRNPLADPGLLGVNAGAGFGVSVAAVGFGITSLNQFLGFAFAGAAAATVLVYLIGRASGSLATPARMLLAGVAITALLGGISNSLSLLNARQYQNIRAWGAGAVTRVSLEDSLLVAPFLIVGVAIALLLAGSLNNMSMGDEVAIALGSNVRRARGWGLLSLTLLAGGATALVGGIAFVGLMIPHVARWMFGVDQRWILPGSLVCGPTLLLLADVLGRVIARPGEIRVSIIVAFVGAPLLIALVMRRRMSGV